MKIRALTAVAFTALLWSGSASAAPPPMMDPSAMSGIPRPDPKLAASTITVRCLGKAGFSAPAVDTEVTLEVSGKDGSTKTFTAKTQAQGRATFDQLAAYVGGVAVAKVTLGGAEVRSGPISILPQTGTAVMLVEGAVSKAAPTRSAAPAGEPAIPAPGNAFPLDGMEVGTLTIGTFDLDARKPVASVVVKLTITPPEGEPIVRELTTDVRGKAVFDNLMPPHVPEGSTLSAEATLVAGGTLRQSKPFTMASDKGMALVLAEGAEAFQSSSNGQPQQAQQQPARTERRPLPGPRILRTLKPGSVRVTLWDANDQPLAGQKLIVAKKTATGSVDKFRAVSGPDGSVLLPEIPVRQDSLYFVESIYGGAPYQSSFFGMDDRGGIDVQLRLFETTNDPSVVRSAVQYDIIEGENDLAQVVQVFEVMVSGDKAFWDPELRIEAMEGAKGFTVLRPAEEFLDHQEKAPFATLHGPISPGKLTNLSVAYLMDHQGAIELNWQAPFDLVQASVLVDEKLELQAEGKTLGDHASPIPGRTVWTLDKIARGETVSFTMSGLRHRDPTLKQVGWIGLGAFGLVVLLGLMRSRPSREQQLTELESAAGDAPRADVLLSELDRVVRQLEVLRNPDNA